MSAPATRHHPARSRAGRQKGFVLITGLLFLVVMTLLGLALFRSTGLMNRITANSRDKERSFEAAQAALQYSGWWLTNSYAGGNGTACAGNTNAVVANLHVCLEPLSTSLPTIAALGWIGQAFAYTPPNMTVLDGGGLVADSSDINYHAAPGVYIERLGLNANGTAQYFQSTAYGYGGDVNTVSVVRSTFKQTSKSSNLKTP